MAIGDSLAVYMGTATTNRQPSSGVFEEVSCLVQEGSNDAFKYNDGTTVVSLVYSEVVTGQDGEDANRVSQSSYNTAIKIGNALYLVKTGSTDKNAVSGVQVNA